MIHSSNWDKAVFRFTYEDPSRVRPLGTAECTFNLKCSRSIWMSWLGLACTGTPWRTKLRTIGVRGKMISTGCVMVSSPVPDGDQVMESLLSGKVARENVYLMVDNFWEEAGGACSSFVDLLHSLPKHFVLVEPLIGHSPVGGHSWDAVHTYINDPQLLANFSATHPVWSAFPEWPLTQVLDFNKLQRIFPFRFVPYENFSMGKSVNVWVAERISVVFVFYQDCSRRVTSGRCHKGFSEMPWIHSDECSTLITTDVVANQTFNRISNNFRLQNKSFKKICVGAKHFLDGTLHKFKNTALVVSQFRGYDWSTPYNGARLFFYDTEEKDLASRRKNLPSFPVSDRIIKLSDSFVATLERPLLGIHLRSSRILKGTNSTLFSSLTKFERQGVEFVRESFKKIAKTIQAYAAENKSKTILLFSDLGLNPDSLWATHILIENQTLSHFLQAQFTGQRVLTRISVQLSNPMAIAVAEMMSLQAADTCVWFGVSTLQKFQRENSCTPIKINKLE
eukprot:jgi/Picre1/33331/NNA_008655.t1